VTRSAAPDVPDLHARFLERALAAWRGEPRLVGVAVGGSWLAGRLDAFSDLDLVLVVADEDRASVTADRLALARAPGRLLQAFSGEHVGEPRMLIALYGPPLLHVDLKFVTLTELGTRIEDPAVLWEREGQLTDRLRETRAVPQEATTLPWIEERLWVWVHYTAEKIRRGELLEALDALAFVRERALAPLAFRSVGRPGRGVRRLETDAGPWAARIAACAARPKRADLTRALEAVIDVYVDLREGLDPAGAVPRSAAEGPVREHVRRLGERKPKPGPSPGV
jgi:hypothetical protein